MGNEIQKIRNAIETHLKQTDKIIVSSEVIAETVSKVNNSLTFGFSELSSGLKELCFNVEYSLFEISYQLELQSEALGAIKNLLERPLDTQAKELRKRAEEAYLNKWYDEAEVDLLEAEKKNYQDFIVHHILGNIYFYHKKNYQKSLEYYQKAAKYAAPRSKEHASNSFLCAAMVYYKIGQLSEAYKFTKLAMELSPEDPRVIYHHARYAAINGYVDEFMECLIKSIVGDPYYLIVADGDEILFGVREGVKRLAKELTNRERNRLSNLIQKIKLAIVEAKNLGISEYDLTSLENKLVEVNRLYVRNSYLDFVKAGQIGREAFYENMIKWIHNINISRSALESKAERVKGLGLDDLSLDSEYSGWGWLSCILTFALIIITYSFSWFFNLVVPILVGLLTKGLLRIWKHKKIRKEIERENNAGIRLIAICEPLLGKLSEKEQAVFRTGQIIDNNNIRGKT